MILFNNKNTLNPLIDSWEWLASNFSLQYHPWIKHKGQENKGKDHQLKKLLIVTQILLVNTLGYVLRTVWRIWILVLRYKRFIPDGNIKFLLSILNKSWQTFTWLIKSY